MKLIIPILCLIFLNSCASAQLTDGGKRVRLSTESPQNCKYLGEVSGNFKGSKTAGIVGDTDEFSRVDIKNQAALMGADTVQILENGDRNKSGEAYDCSKNPAGK